MYRRSLLRVFIDSTSLRSPRTSILLIVTPHIMFTSCKLVTWVNMRGDAITGWYHSGLGSLRVISDTLGWYQSRLHCLWVIFDTT